MTACLDSWAILAWLDGEEPALSRLDGLIDSRPVVSWVNLVEVYYRVERDHGRDAADQTLAALRAGECDLAVAFTYAGTLYDIDVSGPTLEDSSKLRLSSGLGVSWLSPLGPLSLDFTQALIKNQLDQTEFFTVNFGTQF